MRSRTVLTLAASAALATALAGCSSPSTEESVDAYCATLEQTQTEIAGLVSLIGADSTVEDAEDQADVIRDSFEQLADDAQNLKGSLGDDLEGALDTYRDAIDDIPGDASVSEAATAFGAATTALLATLDGVADEVDCS